MTRTPEPVPNIISRPRPSISDISEACSQASAKRFAGTPFRKLLCSIPAIAPLAAAKFMPAGIEAIRGAHLAYLASDPMAAYVCGLDVALAPDGIHPESGGQYHLCSPFLSCVSAPLDLRFGSGSAGLY